MATSNKKMIPQSYGKWLILKECFDGEETKTPSGLILTQSVNSDVRMGQVVSAAGTDPGKMLLFVKRNGESGTPRWADIRIGPDSFIAVPFDDIICRLDEEDLDAGDDQ